ncbi:MAG: tetratricopeptide repeat protein [Bacteroidia bacterium]
MKRSFLLIFCLSIFFRVISQNQFGSLYSDWKDFSKPDTIRLQSFTRLIVTKYLNTQPDSAIYYAEILFDEAEKLGLYKRMGASLQIRGLAWRNLGNLEKALIFQEQSLQLSIEFNNKEGTAGTLINMGYDYHSLGNYSKALECFEQGVVICEEIKNFKDLVKGMGGIAIVYRRQGYNDKAIDYFKKALKIGTENGLEDENFGTLHNLVALFRSNGLTDSALLYIERMEKIAERKDDKYLLAWTLESKGRILSQQGYQPEALEYYLKSLRLYREIKNPKKIADLLLMVGQIYKDTKEFEKAIDFTNQAKDIFEEIGEKDGVGHSLNGLAIIYEEQKSYDKAIDFYQQSLKIQQELGNKNAIAGDLINLGNLYKAMEDFEEATNYYHQGVTICRDIQSDPYLAKGLYGLASISLKRKQYQQAILYARESLKIAQTSNLLTQVQNAAEVLFISYRETGRYKESLDMVDLHFTTRDSLTNLENQRKILSQQYQFEYQTQRLNDSIIFVNQQSALELTHERELSSRNYFLFGGLGLALLAFIFFRYRQQLKTREQELELQRERERKEQLAELDSMKSRFFANISHEFRTPLTLILGQNEQLQSESEKPENLSKYEMVDRNGRRLLELINQVLDLSKIESGKLGLTYQQMDLIPFLKNLFFSFESLADQKAISLSFENNQEELWAMIDPEKMERIMFNLISNAIKFTPEEGKITLIVSSVNNQLTIQVSDTGKGMTKEDLPIF